MLSALASSALSAVIGLQDPHVDYGASHAWMENAGWIDFNYFSFNIEPTVLRGYAWGANIGWLNFGDGAPADGVQYSNLTSDDFGVNLGTNGELSGLAWSENCGWINFGGGAMATPPRPARIDFSARRFEGYAWAENLGWINLGGVRTTLRITFCPADFNSDQVVDDTDFVLFAQQYDQFECTSMLMTSRCAADLNADGLVDDSDFVLFAMAYDEFVCP